VTTTQAATDGSVTWELNDGALNGPWTYQFPAGVSASGGEADCAGLGCNWFQGSYEVEVCLVDNSYTLTKQAGAGWQGTITVLSVVDDNTIYVPVNENWIIHGVNQDDLPVKLDARLSTGLRHRPAEGDFPISTAPLDDESYYSHANIVMRNLRISGQLATPDKPEFTATRTMSNRRIGAETAPRLGGALFYEGFGSKLIFDRSVFDHNFATSGGMMMVDGRMEKQFIANRDSPQMTEIHVLNCLLYKNYATWVGGVLRPNDVFPAVIDFSDTVLVENMALIGNTVGHSMYAVMPACVEDDPTSPGCELVGSSSLEWHRVRSQSYRTDNYLADMSTAIFAGIKAVPGSGYNVVMDDSTQAGMTGFTNVGMNFYDASTDASISLEDHIYIADFVVKDITSYGGQYGAWNIQSDHIEFNRVRFENNHACDTCPGGALRMELTRSSKMQNMEFIGNSAGNGGALWLGGGASHELSQCLFQDNVAISGGGAINWIQTADVDLLVRSSTFVNNQVRLSGTAFSDVLFRLFTGAAGIGYAGSHNDEALAAVHPIWFVAPVDNGLEATGQAHKPGARDGSIDSMRQALSGNTCLNGACPDGSACTCPDAAVCETDQDYTCLPATIYGHRDYGDEYYNTGSTYAEVVKLAAGPHRLWHGAVVSSSDTFTTWDNGGWIDIVEIQDKAYPQWCDNRGTACVEDQSDFYDDLSLLQNGKREPDGCYLATDNGCDAACSQSWYFPFDTDGVPRDNRPDTAGRTREECKAQEITEGAFCCWVGMMYWSYTDFVVPYGVGGAMTIASTGKAQIRDSTFQDNFAGFGASVNAVNLELELTNTTIAMAGDRAAQFTGESDHLEASMATVLTCDTLACDPGMMCRMVDNVVRMCEPCPINAEGDGRTCSQCRPGSQPNAGQTACEPCEPGARSEIGVCQDCEGEALIAPAAGQALCDQCPQSTRADPSHTQCLCDSGTYNGTAALHICFYRGYDAEQFGAELGKHQSMPTGFDCNTCPLDELGDSCLTCEDGRTIIAPGYTIPKLPADATFTMDSDHVSVFRCHADMEIATQRCPGGEGMRRLLSESDGMCASGYEGYMCGECTEGFGMNSNQECEACESAGFTWATLGSMVAMLGGAMVVLGLIGVIWGKFPLKHVVRCAAQPLRVLITYSQVTSQLGDVLDFQYPGIFGGVIETLRPIMDVWGLLFRALGPSECFGLQGFTSRWLLRVVALPLIMCAFVLIVCVVQYCSRGAAYAKSNARSNMFFVVFFCYPTITIVSFAAFICQPLTDSTSVLEIDDAVICEDASHVRMQWLSGAVILVVAVGLPLGLLYVLKTKASYYESNTRKQYSDVAKRMSAELGVELNVAEYVIRDIVVGEEFGFLMDAFQPQFLYWEALDMIRKLALVGLVLLVGRGSIAQLSTAIAISFCFFALHMRSWPYKVHSDNLFRAASELHVFIVIVTALVLKNNLAIEVVTEDAYDYFLFISFILLVPVAFLVAVVQKVRFMNVAVDNGLSLKKVEPKEMRKRSFELHLVGLGSDVDKENLKRFIDGWAVSKKYSCFLSHFKEQAAAEARVMKAELVRALKVPPDSVFLDADNLTDLRELMECVVNSDVFILMWTKDVLSRPWCLAEINAAANAGIPILVVKINNSYRADVGTIDEILSDLPAYLERTNETALAEIQGKEIGLEPSDLAATIKKAIAKDSSEDALTFDPNQSSVMLQSQIHALASAMVQVACPENEALLPDLAPQSVDPWIIARPIAIYIIFAEKEQQMKKTAEDAKDWLCRRCDLAPDSIRLCSDSSGDRSISDATAGDCDDVANNVDTVLLLQSKQVLAEPRSLARLYVAIANRTPIVPVNLTSSDEKDKDKLWNFETAKPTLERLEAVLNVDQNQSLAAASGASAAEVGAVLAQVIPSVISKPLEIEGVRTQIEAQMLDIELTLRREMPAASVATTTAAPRKTVKTTAKNDEGVPPAAVAKPQNKNVTPPRARVAARVVTRAAAKP
jgi:hypothetical protein